MRKELKRGIILAVFIIALVVGIKLIQNYDKIGKQLQKIGYSKDEAKQIVEVLSEEDLNKVLNMEHKEKLVSIITNKYFIPYNLDAYLSFEKDNIDDTIAMVNVYANKDWYDQDTVKATDLEKGNKILVNKFHYLTNEYDPGEISEISIQYAYDGHYKVKNEVYNQYKKMWYAANEQDLTLIVNSAYRTYEIQEGEYNSFGDDYAARPGYSEHQTALALDIVTYDTIANDFENTQEFKWLQDNAHKYGFILRYPKGKDHLTGYAYESWHYRYLGVDLATKVHNSGLTYDEYYAYYCEYKNEC